MTTTCEIQGDPQQEKAISEFSLNRIENSPVGVDFLIKFVCKRCTRILSAGVTYSMCDLIYDVINYCASVLGGNYDY